MSKGPHNPTRETLTASSALAAVRMGKMTRCSCGCGYWIAQGERRTRRFNAQTIRFLERRGLVRVSGDAIKLAVLQ
jgi:hypothetical protein